MAAWMLKPSILEIWSIRQTLGAQINCLNGNGNQRNSVRFEIYLLKRIFERYSHLGPLSPGARNSWRPGADGCSGVRCGYLLEPFL
jgi:hypothetical protein